MFEPLRQLFRSRQASLAQPVLPLGERAYVVGDIHGRLDLFEQLIDAIERDDSLAGTASTTVVLLGDLIDRGPHSAQVVARAREWKTERPLRILAGNHEEMFLDSFEDTAILRHFLKHGGRETLLSYGISEKVYNNATVDELQTMMHSMVPVADRQFIEAFENYVEMGDYLFVHAGIRPEIELSEQERHDMLWIRDAFLRYSDRHSHVVVHGHTIFEEIDERPNRIGIDTGAFRSGRLTALVLEGEERRYIQAVEESGAIAIHERGSVQ